MISLKYKNNDNSQILFFFAQLNVKHVFSLSIYRFVYNNVFTKWQYIFENIRKKVFFLTEVISNTIQIFSSRAESSVTLSET